MHENHESKFTEVRREQPEKVIWENETYFVLKDIAPQAPTHLLVIPKEEVSTLHHMSKEDKGELVDTVDHVAQELGLRSYKMIINVGKPYQEIFHVHAHLISDQTLDD